MERGKLIEEEKQLILKNFLKNAVFDGWTEDNFSKSVKSSGFKYEYALLLFSNGLEDLTQYFHDDLNKIMEENFLTNNVFAKIHEKIIYAIELKFSQYKKHKEAVRCLMKYNLMPQHILSAKSRLWNTCDIIWRLVGDESTDFNYYTKRSILAAVYASSFIYFINDDSEEFSKTKIFIRNRIKNSLIFGKWKKQGVDLIKGIFGCK
jgi:ubiquinone biosynthesis protein COQ9